MHSVTVQVLSFILFSPDRKTFTEVNWAKNTSLVVWHIYVPRFVSPDIQQVVLERPEGFVKVLMQSAGVDRF